jgi:toxin ParE1/3/4
LPTFRFSKAARDDLRDLAYYTRVNWGVRQARKYSMGLRRCCEALADAPLIGRTCAEIYPDLRRMEQGKHVVFYTEKSYGILVLRILHQRVLPENRAFKGTQ